MAINDYLKSSSFLIQFKDQRRLELMVTGVNLPGFTLGEILLSRPVVTDKRPGDHIDFNDLSLTIICDEDLKAFTEIVSSIILSANPNTGDLEISKTVFDATLFLTTNKNNIQHKVHFYNCYFKSISDLPFESTSDDEAHVTFNAELGYSFYNFE